MQHRTGTSGTHGEARVTYTDSEFQHPARQCDLVMKGGITSGVVYPPALLALATQYRFRHIGGTSAGAIAAAAAAAAEYAREGEGFLRLQALERQMDGPGFVRNLFQPSSQTRPLLESALAVLAEKQRLPQQSMWSRLPLAVRRLLRLYESLVRADLVAVLAGALGGIVLEAGWAWLVGGAAGWRTLLLGLVFALLGSLAGGTIHLIWILLRYVPNNSNCFGICIGRGNAPQTVGPEALTDWLATQLDSLAGKDKGVPLTFADLAAKTLADGSDASITLNLVTTNLSLGQPYIFPLDGECFIFKKEEFERFFPPYIVHHMIQYGVPTREAPTLGGEPAKISLPAGCFFLPPGDALPVIVATRLSLSFPLLISAVPLYTISSSVLESLQAGGMYQVQEQDLQQNWFSDGGICSNFPIHFFDNWLPRYPTFGINLTSLPTRAVMTEKQVATPRSLVTPAIDSSSAAGDIDRVFLPQPCSTLNPEYSQIGGIFGFLSAILNTMQNYRDNTQAQLPSYRERIVQIRFDKDSEGGLNLAMDPSTIAAIGRLGTQAATLLFPQGQPGGAFNFDEHQWVRFRVLMAALQFQLVQLQEGFSTGAAYQDLLDKQLNAAPPFHCSESEEWSKDAAALLQTLVALGGQWTKDVGAVMEAVEAQGFHRPFLDHAPVPMPVLRATPKL